MGSRTFHRIGNHGHTTAFIAAATFYFVIFEKKNQENDKWNKTTV